jgi:uncharacterized membrane-anchored protein YitT (DUF2179 family)
MTRERLLLIDAVINLSLGVALLAFPTGLVEAAGFPGSDSAFYPTILGAVLLGIGLSLALEARRSSGESGGLGLLGAVGINMSAAVVLTIWLLVGGLPLPTHGLFLIVLLILTLIGLSACEWYVLHRDRA